MSELGGDALSEIDDGLRWDLENFLIELSPYYWHDDDPELEMVNRLRRWLGWPEQMPKCCKAEAETDEAEGRPALSHGPYHAKLHGGEYSSPVCTYFVRLFAHGDGYRATIREGTPSGAKLPPHLSGQTLLEASDALRKAAQEHYPDIVGEWTGGEKA